jgi:hypothetical protein
MTKSVMIRMPRACASATSWLEVLQGAELGQDRGVIGDVVAAITQRARVERGDPQAVDAEPLQVVQREMSPWKSPLPDPVVSV